MSKLIGVGDFVKRQTPDSRFSHFNGAWEELERLAEENFLDAKPGYRDGVVLVPIPKFETHRFQCGFVRVREGMELRAVCEARRPGEKPSIHIEAVVNDPASEKVVAKAVDIVLYRKDVLDENNEASTDCDWEIVSVNARPDEGDEPMTAGAMARNMLEETGGTKGDYTGMQFAESIAYWRQFVSVGAKEEKQ